MKSATIRPAENASPARSCRRRPRARQGPRANAHRLQREPPCSASVHTTSPLPPPRRPSMAGRGSCSRWPEKRTISATSISSWNATRLRHSRGDRSRRDGRASWRCESWGDGARPWVDEIGFRHRFPDGSQVEVKDRPMLRYEEDLLPGPVHEIDVAEVPLGSRARISRIPADASIAATRSPS